MKGRNIALGVLSLLMTASSQTLPYNPTTILLSESSPYTGDIAYVFLPASTSNAAHQLLSINISSTISTANLSFETLTPSLPFQSDGTEAFIPLISFSGKIYVYTGSCNTSSSSEFWVFSSSNTSTNGNGTWVKESTTAASDVTAADLPGADFLSQAISFSTNAQADAMESDIYIFGGMCPENGANESTWQSAASYSDNMLRFSPDTSSGYTVDLTTSSGPPIAEAGFTITGLAQSYSNSSGILMQQQNFVLLGGHTQTAFINMSQVAIWSLPEESWSFMTIKDPLPRGSTELTVKSLATSVDSRSGHTAVLTEDGTKIIVFGGWVGDVSQAADPQLAVLEVGAGFGGTGDWTWSIPTVQPSGSGIYGHGAVLLPGGVMMILGGYNITTTGNTKRDVTAGTNAMFLNTTSLSWISDYTNPRYTAGQSNSMSIPQSQSSKSGVGIKLGLGLGLGLGLAAILVLVLIWYCYSRRLRQKREFERDEHIRAQNAGQIGFQGPNREMSQRPRRFSWGNEDTYIGVPEGDAIHDSESSVAGYDNYHNHPSGLYEDYDIPPIPRHIARKPLYSQAGRAMYQPTPNYDNPPHGRSNSLGTAGPIHPIYEEADEDETGSLQRERYSDPFQDQAVVFPLHHRDQTTPEPETPTHSREREIHEWVSDWAAADALMDSQTQSHSAIGRVSPTRRAQLIAASNVSSLSGENDSGRTASNLSERSVAISAMTVSRSGSSSQGSRSNSLRDFIQNAMSQFGGSAHLSTTVASTALSPIFDVPDEPAPHSAESGSSSFTTARSSFPALQAEAEVLLHRPDERSRSGQPSPERQSPEPTSPSKTKAPPFTKNRTGWLGSLRRHFTGDSAEAKHSSLSTFGFDSRTPSPVRATPASPPNRTVSATSALWRRKQGRSDWEDSDLDRIDRRNTFTGDLHSMAPRPVSDAGTYEEDEWDIERAVQNRVVQVMFTVPKERLRVVNHDVDADRSDAGSLRSKKGSNHSIREPMPSLTEALSTPERQGQQQQQQPSSDSHHPLPTLPLRLPDRPGRISTPEGKGKGRVQDIVEKLEARSPSQSPERRF